MTKKRTTIFIPEHLKLWIQARAASEHRSMNQVVMMIFEKEYAAEKDIQRRANKSEWPIFDGNGKQIMPASISATKSEDKDEPSN